MQACTYTMSCTVSHVHLRRTLSIMQYLSSGDISLSVSHYQLSNQSSFSFFTLVHPLAANINTNNIMKSSLALVVACLPYLCHCNVDDSSMADPYCDNCTRVCMEEYDHDHEHELDSCTPSDSYGNNVGLVFGLSGVAKGGPSRARPYQSSMVPNQKSLNWLPLCTQNNYTYR